MRRDKELSVQQILAEEKQILQGRFYDELQKLQKDNAKATKNVAAEALSHKTRNERLNNQVLDKEADILQL